VDAGLPPEPSAAGGADAGLPPEPSGVTELFGLLAYASLVSFFRLTQDAARAGSLDDKAALAGMAAAEFGHFQLLSGGIQALQREPSAAMRPFVEAIDEFHARTTPADWVESLVKAYVSDGIVADFYRMVAQLLDEPTRELVLEVLVDTGQAQFAVARVREAIVSDPRLAGRLALWARRLFGEALGLAQRVMAEHEQLARLLDARAVQPAPVGRMFSQLTDYHAGRMAALGLAV
jgi:hypothetical protein